MFINSRFFLFRQLAARTKNNAAAGKFVALRFLHYHNIVSGDYRNIIEIFRDAIWRSPCLTIAMQEKISSLGETL